MSVDTLSFWTTLNLDARRSQWDDTAIAIEAAKQTSRERRKDLASATKAARKQPLEHRLAATQTLLKAYQTEIDTLTARAKSAEDAFFDMYRLWASAPDPGSALADAQEMGQKVKRLEALEREHARAQQALADFRAEHRGLEDQAVTVATLREKIKRLEGSVEQRAAERAEQREAEAALAAQRAEAGARQDVIELKRRVEQAEAAESELRRRHDDVQSQLFDATAVRDKERAALRAEIDLLAAECAKRADTEQMLRQELERVRGAGAVDIIAVQEQTALEALLASRDEELTATRETQVALERRLENEMRRYHERLTTLTQEHRAAEEQVKQLSEKLASAPDRDEFDALRKKIDVFREMGYDGGATDDDSNVEHMLRETLRQRETAAALAQVARGEAEERAKAAEERAAAASAENVTLRDLCDKLENDLRASLARVGTHGDPKDELADLCVDEDEDDDVPSAVPESDNAGGQTALLRLVCAQRDRLQQRFALLETEMSTLESARHHAVERAAHLEQDNVSLYEKVRFLESYNAELPARRRAQRDLEAAEQVLEKYKPMYEQKVSPFAEFEREERARQVSRLNAPERMVMTTGMMLLRHRGGRLFVLFYAVLMHAMVLVMNNRYSACVPLSNPKNL